MSDSSPPRHYSQEQVGEILRLALTRREQPGMISHEDLLEAAREVGIPEQDLDAAASLLLENQEVEREIALEKARRKRSFFQHLTTYLLINAFLLTIDLLTGGGLWFYWPLLGWGLLVALDGMNVFLPSLEDPEKRKRRFEKKRMARRRRLEKEAAKRRRKEALAGLTRGASELGAAVAEGTGSLLSAAARGISSLSRSNETSRPTSESAEPGLPVIQRERLEITEPDRSSVEEQAEVEAPRRRR